MPFYKKYFNDFSLVTHDITINLSNGKRVMRPCRQTDWTVSVVDTGERTMTGAGCFASATGSATRPSW